MFNSLIIYILLWFEFYFLSIICFNLSPTPSIVFTEPKTVIRAKERSSYFGFSINLRKSSVFIGAPRAQPSLKSQSNSIEPGAIYKCGFTNNTQCFPYIFDDTGNTIVNNGFSINTHIKDNQWLGSAIDGFTNDDDELIACASRRMINQGREYSINGICYSKQKPNNSLPINVQIFAKEMFVPSNQMINIKRVNYFYYIMGQQGFSLHLSDNRKEIIIGAPGVFQWRGAVIRRRKINNLKNYENDITNYLNSNVNINLYFGYAVSSGNFLQENDVDLLYVASAPSHNKKPGETYIFNIINYENPRNIYLDIHKVFKGLQLGDYFGYAILTEDFNNDGLPDLAISAPMHSKTLNYENGIVYIYINKKGFNFILQRTLSSEYKFTSRFGTALGRIGDLNLDGYNDIAIGAPFEENGAVYIYFGEANGVSAKPSQRITPKINEFTYPGKMFGHSISRGVDIDENGYLDIAIGSPEDEKVYFYKTYPIVKIIASIQPASTQILTENTSMKIKFCWYIETKTDLKTNIDINLIIKLDEDSYRVKSNGSNIINKNVSATLHSNCMELNVTIRYIPSHIFKPITIEMHYDLLKKITNNTTEFCNECVLINPHDNKMITSQIVFINDCDNDVCLADLKLTSKWINSTNETLIVGKTKSITIEYTVINNGQPAFLPQINITFPQHISPMKLLSNCDLFHFYFICIYNRPLKMYGEIKLKIKFDISELEENHIMLSGLVTTISTENNKEDNNDIFTLIFNEYSEIDILSKSMTKTQYSIDDSLPVENLTYIYEIINKGPSYLQDFSVTVSIPVAYIDLKSSERCNIIQFDNVIMFLNNREKILKPKWNITASDVNHKRLLRSVSDDSQIIENNLDNILKISHLDAIDLNKIKINYPVAKTIFFNCETNPDEKCIQGLFIFKDTRIDKENSFTITITLPINMTKIDNILTKERNIFILSTGIKINKLFDVDGNSLKVLETIPYTEIEKTSSISIWIYIVAILGGLLLLILITYGLYKFGFFKRAKKEEMKKLAEVEKEKARARASAIENANKEKPSLNE